MQLRWTRGAERASALVRTVYEAPALLLEFPHRGRPGNKAGTRRDGWVFVVRILLGAQRWP